MLSCIGLIRTIRVVTTRIGRRASTPNLTIKGMSVLVKATRLATRAPRFLTHMTEIAFAKPAVGSTRTYMLPHDIPHDLDQTVIDVTVVKLTAQVAAFAAQVVLVAELVLFGSAGVCVPFFVCWLRDGSVDALSVFVDVD